MKNSAIRARMIAVAFAAVTMCSVGSMAMDTTASSENTIIVAEGKRSADAEKAEAAYNAIADLFPGGRTALDPFRDMIMEGYDKDDLEKTKEKHTRDDRL